MFYNIFQLQEGEVSGTIYAISGILNSPDTGVTLHQNWWHWGKKWMIMAKNSIIGQNKEFTRCYSPVAMATEVGKLRHWARLGI